MLMLSNHLGEMSHEPMNWAQLTTTTWYGKKQSVQFLFPFYKKTLILNVYHILIYFEPNMNHIRDYTKHSLNQIATSKTLEAS